MLKFVDCGTFANNLARGGAKSRFSVLSGNSIVYVQWQLWVLFCFITGMLG